MDSLGEPVNLLGHSYGGLVALEAALLTRNVRKLVLYDPGIEVAGEEIYPHEVVERMEAMLAAGDRDGVVETTMREVAGLPPEAVEYMRALPVWQARVDAAHTIPRELRAIKSYRFDPERFKNLGTPTLLLSWRRQPGCLAEGRGGRGRGAAGLPHRRHGRARSLGNGYRDRPLHGRGTEFSGSD